MHIKAVNDKRSGFNSFNWFIISLKYNIMFAFRFYSINGYVIHLLQTSFTISTILENLIKHLLDILIIYEVYYYYGYRYLYL